jgi:uncharacterized protein YijF (DUF1287 family)
MRTLVFAWLFLFANVVSAQSSESLKVVTAARAQIGVTTTYDPAYSRIAYPMGDVVQSKGVCTDVVIRAYRKLNVDFQMLVHKDMKANFSLYPKIWGLKKTDSNIDHRRVPNLEVFFKRQGKALNLPQASESYKPGDIVSWRLDNGLAHIGIVSDKKSLFGSRPLVIHNIGQGTQEEDVLFAWRIVGHYRWFNAAGAGH